VGTILHDPDLSLKMTWADAYPPAMREQLGDAAGRMRRQPLEHVA
jgi:hypothetical protein